MDYRNYLIWSNIENKYLTANYAIGTYEDGFTKKISRAIIFDSEEQAREWWDDKILCKPLFELREI